MSAAALTNPLAQPQEDPQIVFEGLNMIKQLQEILKVAVCNRCKIEVFYHVRRLPLLYAVVTAQPGCCVSHGCWSPYLRGASSFSKKTARFHLAVCQRFSFMLPSLPLFTSSTKEWKSSRKEMQIRTEAWWHILDILSLWYWVFYVDAVVCVYSVLFQ